MKERTKPRDSRGFVMSAMEKKRFALRNVWLYGIMDKMFSRWFHEEIFADFFHIHGALD